MTSDGNLQKLLTWLSPAFPVGAFAWSAGMETAIATRIVHDPETVLQWIVGSLEHGSMRTDAILLVHAYRCAYNPPELADLINLALALTPARERYEETTITGHSFATAAATWPTSKFPGLPEPCPYPIAVGAIAACHDLGLAETLIAWMTAGVHGQVSVAVRLVPIGQLAGLKIMADLEGKVAALADLWQDATLGDIGTVAYAADIAQMAHETSVTRIFRS